MYHGWHQAGFLKMVSYFKYERERRFSLFLSGYIVQKQQKRHAVVKNDLVNNYLEVESGGVKYKLPQTVM